ncbi:MAG: 50S ribosomal protein L22 [Candidatus Moranbacteria bacterium]|nr:50S ribosomal protein L22 [Candidatus Moranbacteria bacterium]MDD3964455.1 50S ribosomal protein L22 [Candidatus Moranbacteria bacterium]
MKVQATLTNLRIAPRKVRLVTHALVGIDANEALIQLSKLVKKSSEPIATLLKSAIANATHNNGLDAQNLYIFEIRVGDGLRLKRWLPRAFGRATPLLHRGSNVTIILEEKIEGKNRTEKKTNEEIVTIKEADIVETKKAPAVSKHTEKIGSNSGVSNKTTAGKVVKKVFQRKSI